MLTTALLPEIILCVTACFLFLLGTSSRALSRKIAGEIAVVAVAACFVHQWFLTRTPSFALIDTGLSIHVQYFSQYVKLIVCGVGLLLVLLNLTTNKDSTATSASQTGTDTAEFFALMLLSLAGVCAVASANDLILLFLGIELASLPIYVMVGMSRPIPVAQEAGLKYFFLGAMSAAVMLFGFSYLYGTTGTTSLDSIATCFAPGGHTSWQVLAVVLLIAGFAFKMVAVPLHSYAGDVYQGAATPVTAFISFVPKVNGFVALIKILFAVGGTVWVVPDAIFWLMWLIAAFSMTFGNLLAVLQYNLKRMMAYSSVAHTGYMAVGITALLATHDKSAQEIALAGVLFYLAAYGIMNVAAFGVLMLLPARHPKPATSAETLEDLAGQGRNHVVLGLAMAVACFSLTGIPPTVGFIGKMFLAIPASDTFAHPTAMIWLSVILWINAAISAAYYLRIVGTMFLRPEPTHLTPGTAPQRMVQPASIVIAVFASSVLTILLGVPPTMNYLYNRAGNAAKLDVPVTVQPNDVAAAGTPAAGS
jgi:NADH-quinone oxidoreductase subunit N